MVRSPNVRCLLELSPWSNHQDISHGHLVFQSTDRNLGITTGFGGSANTKTDHPFDLQRSLLQHQQSGILPVIKKPGSIRAKLKSPSSRTFMPEEWVRGAMLVRCKSLCSGYSAIRWECIETLMAMVNANLIPLVPLRGSISASGDLQPLSYIAGAMEGNPDIWVWTDDGEGGRDLIQSNVALAKAHATACKFGPKEGLAILNGTAFSTSVAALVVHEANQLAVLAQILTAMSVEALMGSTGSFDPFFATVRPHEGQAEAANNVRMWLKGSSLACHTDDGSTMEGRLRQDRYSIRTASQWIGPQLQDLALATKQITVECNSATDNPLLDVEDGAVHHGGNFQAASVTSAMEKTRLSLQMFGRMLFQQCTELINDKTNNGLPPDLAADDHSTSYTFKGIDINVAAYASELGYLANPVSSHVQAAEMGNQGINSLALISARYTSQAIETLSSMCASHLYALCQALDLRAMNAAFLESAAREIHELTYEAFEYALTMDELEVLQRDVVSHVLGQISKTTEKDAEDRFQYIAKSALSVTVPYLTELGTTRIEERLDLMGMIREWQVRCSERLLDLFKLNRDDYFQSPDASKYLGMASRKIYHFIRHELKVPFHKGLVDYPSEANGLMTIGGYTSIIYEALRDGTLYSKLMGLVEEISIDGAESEAGDLKSNGVSNAWEKMANYPDDVQA